MLQQLLENTAMKYMFFGAIIVVVINLIAFILMGIDKAKAKRHKRRIREAVLLGLAVCGGGFGILIGMAVFRHKTNASRHPAFVNGVPIILLTELLLSLFAVSFYFK